MLSEMMTYAASYDDHTKLKPSYYLLKLKEIEMLYKVYSLVTSSAQMTPAATSSDRGGKWQSRRARSEISLAFVAGELTKSHRIPTYEMIVCSAYS